MRAMAIFGGPKEGPQFDVSDGDRIRALMQAFGAGRSAASRARRERMVFITDRTRRPVMIHHLSIAARDPKRAAETLAELMGGTAVPFPPNPGSYFALQLDNHGSGVEVYPAGTELEPNGSTGGSFVKQQRGRGYGLTNCALGLATDVIEVDVIAYL